MVCQDLIYTEELEPLGFLLFGRGRGNNFLGLCGNLWFGLGGGYGSRCCRGIEVGSGGKWRRALGVFICSLLFFCRFI